MIGTKGSDVLGPLMGGLFRGYQRPWIRAASRSSFVAHLGARQVGKDRTWGGGVIAPELVLRRGAVWHCLSATQRHAGELLREVRRFVLLYLDALKRAGWKVPRLVTNNVGEIELSNGSRCLSHAATPKAIQGARGSGGVLLNELGAMARASDVYETVYSIITAQHDQGRPSRLICIGNAAHRGSAWHTLWTGLVKDRSKDWTLLRDTWEGCYRSWLAERGWAPTQIDAWIAPRKAERVRRLGRAAFEQWYECKWRSPEDSYFAPELLERQSFDPVTWNALATGQPTGHPGLGRQVAQTIGYDPARKHHPAGVCQVLCHAGSTWGHRPRRLKIPTWEGQIDELGRLVGERNTISLVADDTGPGDGPCELAEKRFGSHMVLRYPFTLPSRMALASNTKEALETGRAWIPAETDLLMELGSLSSQYTDGGRETLIIPQDGGTHADMAVAYMLGQWGASHVTPRPSINKVRSALSGLR